MTNQSPWSIKGIKPGNRDTVKELAGKHGLTIGEYVNSLIEEAESRVTSKSAPIYAPVFDPNFQIPPSAAQNQPIYQAGHNNYAPELQPFPTISMGDTSRLALAMEALNQKLDNVANYSRPQTNSELKNIAREEIENAERIAERAISSLLQRVEDNEGRTSRNFDQIGETLKDVRQAQETIGERLRRIERDDPNSKAAESLRSLEQSLTQLAKQIADTDTRTHDLAQKLESVSQNRMSPQDVEKILDGSMNVVDARIDKKLGEVQGRLSSIEEIATMSIEQTDKGISLLSERVKDQENVNSRNVESVKDALVDLSARLAQMEGKTSEDLKDALESRFSGLVRRIEQIDDSVENFVASARRELDEKFANLSSELQAQIKAPEHDTIGAIENLGEQLVKTAESFDNRIRGLEEINENTKDHGLAMRIELGRITHAIDSRLSAIENQGGGAGPQSNENINRLAEQVTNQLRLAEERTSEFINKMASENRALFDSVNNIRNDQMAQIDQKISQIDQKFDQKFEMVNEEIKASENRAKAINGPLHHSIEEVLNRLDTMENRGLGAFSETISPPLAPQIVTSQPIIQELEGDIGHEFADLGEDFEQISEAEPLFGETELTSPEDEVLGFNQSGFVNDLAVDDPFGDSLFGADIDENADADDEDDGVNRNAYPPPKDSSYLVQARHAAILAANELADKKKKNKKAAQNLKPAPIMNDGPSPIDDAIFDTSIIETSGADENKKRAKAQKPAQKSGGLSPIGKVAAGTLVLATLSTGYVYYNKQHQQPDQSELPQSLKTAPLANPASAPEIAPNAPNVAPPVLIDKAPQPNAPAAIAPNPAPIAAPKLEQPKPLAPTKPIAPAAQNKAPQFVPAPVPVAAPKPQAQLAPKPQAPVQIASANIPQPKAPAAPMKVEARTIYDAALAKQKAGDMASYTKLLTQSADAGDTRAQNRLAKMYEKGDGIGKNLNEARKWTERAALAGSRQAQHNLGVYYAEGDGTPQNFSKAADNFNKAARRGLTDSQFNLGAMHEQGLGTSKSLTEAYYWYSLAAKSGDADAVGKSREVAGKLNANDKATLDKKISNFRPQSGGSE